jgi:acid phosphatase
MKKQILIFFATLVCTVNFLFAQSLPAPDHIVIVLEENHAYEEIMGDSSADAPYINSLITDTDAALFTQSYALTHPSQPNYLLLFSGDDQGVTSDDISTSQFTTCNLGAELLAGGFTFTGYAEEEPSVGYLGTSSVNFARKHCPWTNWQGSSSNAIPSSCNVPYTSFPTNYASLPTVSFVIPDLIDDMHSSLYPTATRGLKIILITISPGQKRITAYLY